MQVQQHSSVGLEARRTTAECVGKRQCAGRSYLKTVHGIPPRIYIIYFSIGSIGVLYIYVLAETPETACLRRRWADKTSVVIVVRYTRTYNNQYTQTHVVNIVYKRSRAPTKRNILSLLKSILRIENKRSFISNARS